MIVASRAAPARLPSADVAAPPLASGARVDVCIVGAGLAEMVAAYLLARDKRSVLVVDEGPIGGVAPGTEMAHLASMIEQPFQALERLHGENGARMAAESFAAAIDAIEAIVRRERIACEFERLDGYGLARAGAWRGDLEHEVEAARRAGLKGVELATEAPVERGGASCVRYPAQAQLHPLKFVAGLARAITREGGRIHCGVRTRSVHSSRPSYLMTSAGHRIEADAIVMPAGARPPMRTANVVGLRVPRGAVARALYWESGERLRCARLRTGTAHGEVLLAAGNEDHEALAAWARERFPCAGEVVQRSSGAVMQTADLFAFVGQRECDAESVYVSTSSWGSAMTRAAIAGMVIKDFIDGARMPWGELYMPSACFTPGG